MDGDPPPDGPRLLSRSDLRLRARAIRERWDVPAEMITETLFQVAEIYRTAGTERHIIAAARLLAAAVDSDLRADKLDLERAKLTPPKETQARDAWDEVLRDIRSEGITGSAPGSAGGLPASDPGTQPLE